MFGVIQSGCASAGGMAQTMDSEIDFESERESLLAARAQLQQQWMDQLEQHKSYAQDLLKHAPVERQSFAADPDLLCVDDDSEDLDQDDDVIERRSKSFTRELFQLCVVVFSHFTKIFGAFLSLVAIVFTPMFGCCFVTTTQIVCATSIVLVVLYTKATLKRHKTVP